MCHGLDYHSNRSPRVTNRDRRQKKANETLSNSAPSPPPLQPTAPPVDETILINIFRQQLSKSLSDVLHCGGGGRL